MQIEQIEAPLLEHLVRTALAQPDALGEALRDYVFVDGEGFDAYSTFTIPDRFTPVEDRGTNPLLEALALEIGAPAERATFLRNAALLSDGVVDVLWERDHGVQLGFRHVASGTMLRNPDAKKRDGWEWVRPADEASVRRGVEEYVEIARHRGYLDNAEAMERETGTRRASDRQIGYLLLLVTERAVSRAEREEVTSLLNLGVPRAECSRLLDHLIGVPPRQPLVSAA